MISFDRVAEGLDEEMRRHFAARGQSVDHPGRQMTLASNSTLVGPRAAPLLAMIAERRPERGIEGAALADLGCGFGALSLYFHAQGARVTGLDPNRAKLRVGRRVAARFGLDARFVEGRMQDLGQLADASVDIVVQNNTFCYVVAREERHRALAEVLRVLRPGGLLIARTPNRAHPIDRFTRLPLIQWLTPRQCAWVADRLGRARPLVRLTSPRRGRVELEAAGFVDVRQVGTHGLLRSSLRHFVRYHHLLATRP